MESNSAPAIILVGIDGSTSSIEALRGAAKIAGPMNAHLKVIAAWEYPAMFYPVPDWSPEKDARNALSSTLVEAFGTEQPEGLESDVLRGPRGHGGFAGLLLGSVSTACAQHARCPVLIMHHADDSKITRSAPPSTAAAAQEAPAST